MNTRISDNYYQWTFEITGRGRSLQSSLKDIPKYKDLLLLFTRRDLVADFKQTLLGPAWIFVLPIVTTLAYAIVFGGIAKLGDDNIPDILFYLLGVTFWGLFSTIFNGAANLFVINQHIFSKVYFPRLVSMLAIVLSKLIIFMIQLLLFIGIVVVFYLNTVAERINVAILLIPINILIIATVATGSGLIIAALTVRYRDFRKLIVFGTQLILYATPVIYSSESVPENIAAILRFNPLNSAFDSLRWGLFDSPAVSAIEYGYSITVATLILAIGVLLFHRTEQSFVDEI